MHSSVYRCSISTYKCMYVYNWIYIYYMSHMCVHLYNYICMCIFMYMYGYMCIYMYNLYAKKRHQLHHKSIRVFIAFFGSLMCLYISLCVSSMSLQMYQCLCFSINFWVQYMTRDFYTFLECCISIGLVSDFSTG